ARRERAIGLVERDLEREAAVAGQEVALERQRAVVEKQTQHHQLAEIVRRGRRVDEELLLGLAAGQRAALTPFPAAGLQLDKRAKPGRRVLAGLELSPAEPTLLAEALLLSADLLQRQARDRATQIAFGIFGALEECPGRPVAHPERTPPSVQLLHQELVHDALGGDRSQLDQRRAGFADEPVERRGDGPFGVVAAHQ